MTTSSPYLLSLPSVYIGRFRGTPESVLGLERQIVPVRRGVKTFLPLPLFVRRLTRLEIRSGRRWWMVTCQNPYGNYSQRNKCLTQNVSTKLNKIHHLCYTHGTDHVSSLDIYPTETVVTEVLGLGHYRQRWKVESKIVR